MNRMYASLAVVLLLQGCFGCAHYPRNTELQAFKENTGYRFSNLNGSDDANNLFVLLTFSGGGTRAAAFSYGILEHLASTQILVGEEPQPLLDEVDVISSVSGGSFTAAYYGLFGNDLFRDFKEKFLYKNIQRALLLRLLYPVNWLRSASPYFDRIDMAAAYYDKQVFNRKTYADLIQEGRRPFIIINATDMGLGSRFEFTQDQFDGLYSDLSSFRVARAVAASSAFPGLLSPLRVINYPNPEGAKGEDLPLFKGEPRWLENALADKDRTDTLGITGDWRSRSTRATGRGLISICWTEDWPITSG